MFTEPAVYVNELYWTDVSGSERHTYSFNAHAIEHVENVLCCNVSRWALSVRATSQASYCGIDHTDPHLPKHTHTNTFRASVQVQSRNCSPCSVGRFCSIALMYFSCWGRTVASCLSDEWAQPQDGTLILLSRLNHSCDIITAWITWNCRSAFGILLVFCVLTALLIPHTQRFLLLQRK